MPCQQQSHDPLAEYKVQEIKVLAGNEETAKARQLLEATARQVQPIMRKRQVRCWPSPCMHCFACSARRLPQPPPLHMQTICHPPPKQRTKNDQWRVPLLSEFSPRQPGLLGLNINRGQEVRIRLRPPAGAGGPAEFYSDHHVLMVMLHELTHIVHSERLMGG